MALLAKDFQPRNRRMLSVLLAAIMAVAALSLAVAPAMAQTTDPTDAQYSGTDDLIDSGVAGGDDSGVGNSNGAPTGSAAGGLPFTGLDVGLASVVGALLLGAGLMMRRASRSPGANA